MRRSKGIDAQDQLASSRHERLRRHRSVTTARADAKTSAGGAGPSAKEAAAARRTSWRKPAGALSARDRRRSRKDTSQDRRRRRNEEAAALEEIRTNTVKVARAHAAVRESFVRTAGCS